MNRAHVPGGTLLGPAPLAALALLIFNDHWLKRFAPGVISGKLSDFAGLFFLPVFLNAAFEVVYACVRGALPAAATSRKVQGAILLLSTLSFALPEVWPAATDAYRYWLAALGWPLRAMGSLITGHSLPSFRPVRSTADLTDLLALPMAWLGQRISRPRGARVTRGMVERASAPSLGLAVFLLSPPAAQATEAQDRSAHRHDGLYLALDGGVGAALAFSGASVSNGFAQDIPSSAQSITLLGGLEIAATLRQVVFGVRFTRGQFSVMRVRTLNRSFTQHGGFALSQVELLSHYYPNPRSNLQLGVGGGMAQLRHQGRSWVNTDLESPEHGGICGSLEVGDGLWMANQWSLSLNLRVTAAVLGGDRGDTTFLLLPSALARIAWH